MDSADQTFLHAVDAASDQAFYPCLNLCRTRQLHSPDFIASLDPGLGSVHQNLTTLPLSVLAEAPFPPGAISPATRCLLIAANERNGVHLNFGDGRALERAVIEYCRQRAAVEIEFERVRREVAMEAVSRLSCLWLAENTDEG